MSYLGPLDLTELNAREGDGLQTGMGPQRVENILHHNPDRSAYAPATRNPPVPKYRSMARRGWLCLCLALAPPALCLAALGDEAASVLSDSQALNATPRAAAHAAFTVHELQTPTGTVIREFVAPSGVVFAVSWKGPFKPNLPVLLGRYFAEYANAPRMPGNTRSHLKIEQPGLIVHAAGRMRQFAGLAYLPQLLPADVSEGDLH